MVENETGTLLSCDDEACDCRIRVEVPCPHADQYTCACGRPLVPFEGPRPLEDAPG
jgi:metallothionein